MRPTTSFTTRKLNSSTFVVQEQDAYVQYPLIYVKIHTKVPVIVLSDTGCDEPNDEHSGDRFIHLRKYLEEYPVEANFDIPLNPPGDGGLRRQYYIICTHCHFDHIGGISQFLEGGTTEIIASAAGKDFVESDLESHGEFKFIDRPVPYYQVSHWAESWSRLKWPIWHEDEPKPFQTDMGITIIQTPGHTPDSLAWYDHDEMHLSCGDSFYEEGDHGEPIIFTVTGNLTEWIFSMQKLLTFVKAQNATAAQAAEQRSTGDWVDVPRRVKVSCAHETASVDGEEILEHLRAFAFRIYSGIVPIVKEEVLNGALYFTWREPMEKYQMSMRLPPKLLDDCRKNLGPQ